MGAFKLQPFPFQDEAVRGVIQHYASGLQSVLLQSPPSSGKTVMAAMIIDKFVRTVAAGKRVYFFVHLDNLFGSTAKALTPFFPNSQDVNQVLKSAKTIRRSAKVHVFMTQTFNSRFERKNWKELLNEDDVSLCIFDECHRGEHDKIISYIRENKKGIKVLGLSGTPKKPKNAKVPLHKLYDSKVFTVSELELIEMGRTVPPHIVLPEEHSEGLDLESVPKIQSGADAGEYRQGALSAHMRKKRYIYSDFADLWNEYAENTKTLAFCVDIDHCVDVVTYLNEEKGIPAKFFTSQKQLPKMPAEGENDYEKKVIQFRQKKALYDKYQDAVRKGYTGTKNEVLREWGESYHILVNGQIFTTGFDDDNIKTIVDLAPTMSENLYLQKWGRGKRYKEDKEFYFAFDLCEAVKTFGLPTARRDYPLHVSERKRKKGEAPVKCCPSCGQMIPAVETVCTSPIYQNFDYLGICGHEFQRIRPERETKFTLVRWDEITKMNGFSASNFFESSTKATISDLYEFWKRKGYKSNWFYQNLYKSFGVEGFLEFAEMTNRNTDKFLEDVQRNVQGLNILDEARKYR